MYFTFSKNMLYSPVEGDLGCFQFDVIICKAAINTVEHHVYLFAFLKEWIIQKWDL